MSVGEPPHPHDWVRGQTAFFGAMGGFQHFKLCSRCGVQVRVTRDEYECLPQDSHSQEEKT